MNHSNGNNLKSKSTFCCLIIFYDRMRKWYGKGFQPMFGKEKEKYCMEWLVFCFEVFKSGDHGHFG